jgi:hypothetical protein
LAGCSRFLNLLSKGGENAVMPLSTHIVEDVSELCTRMAIIDQREILAAVAADETSWLFCDHEEMTARISFAFGFLCLLLVCACSSTPPAVPAAMPATFDACALLTPADVKDVQGEEPVESKASEQSDGNLIIHQCFFRLAEFSKSVSVSAGTVGRAHWNRMFAERAESEEEGREREGRGGDARRPVRGLGDEAYWLPTPVGGTLYVRQGEDLLRIALGGSVSDADRLMKATTLAGRALPRLP